MSRNPIRTATRCSSPRVGAVAINPAFRSDLPYDPLKDFAAVGKAAVNSPVLVVNADMKVNSARELAEIARKKPGAITIGITGRGAMSDLGLQLFEAAAGIQVQSVPYRGAAQAITDILAGHLDGLVGDVPTVMAQVRAGRLKALATHVDGALRYFPQRADFRRAGLCRHGRRQLGGRAGAGRHAGARDREVQRRHGRGAQRRRLARAAAGFRDHAGAELAGQLGRYLREEIAPGGAVIREKGLKGE